jgi:hypothetical protein
LTRFPNGLATSTPTNLSSIVLLCQYQTQQKSLIKNQFPLIDFQDEAQIKLCKGIIKTAFIIKVYQPFDLLFMDAFFMLSNSESLMRMNSFSVLS